MNIKKSTIAVQNVHMRCIHHHKYYFRLSLTGNRFLYWNFQYFQTGFVRKIYIRLSPSVKKDFLRIFISTSNGDASDITKM